MNKKYICLAFLFVIIAFMALVGSWFWARYRESANVRGEYVFAVTRGNMENLHHIQIISPNGAEINLYREEEVWKFREANNYFANTDSIASFLYMVNTSIIYDVGTIEKGTEDKYGLDEQNAVMVKTYDANGALLDEVIFGKLDGEGKYRFAGDKKYKKRFYKITSDSGFSDFAQNWIPYPLLNIDRGDVIGLDTAIGKLAGRELNTFERRYIYWHKILDNLSFIDYMGLSLKTDLRNLPEKIVPHRLDIIMIGGLIYQFDVYYIEDSYWLAITLKTEKIARKEVFPFVEENQKYFADWLFHLNFEQGGLFYGAGKPMENE